MPENLPQKKDIVPIIKTVFLALLLFIESYLLTSLMAAYAQLRDYFSPPTNMVILLAIGLLLLAYTYALTIGIWNKWEQYIVVSIPVCLGIFVRVVQINPTYAFALTIIGLTLITYDIYFASSLKSQLISFNPRIILRVSTRGLLFIFALVGGALILMEPSNKNIDIGNLIASEVGEQVENFIMQSPTFQPLNQYGFSNLINVEELIETEVNKYVFTYRDYVLPLLALVALGFIQFLNFLVLVIFSSTVGFLFKLAKSTGFFQIEKEVVEREVLKF